jgi:Trk-type K+ transport system membrane component
LPVVLLITILAIMSGELGYQAMSRFLERHRRNLWEHLTFVTPKLGFYVKLF